jgi:uncharacterized protein
VIILDSNILLYTYSQTSPFHDAASAWLEQAMERREDLGLPWITILGFVRLAANPKAFGRYATTVQAIGVIEELTEQSNVQVITPGPAHLRILARILKEAQVTRSLVSDAHLAALAIEHNATICTNDRDFTRFPGLKILNPVAKQ